MKKWQDFEGDYDKVEEEIKKYFREFPVEGYQTKILDDTFCNGVRKVTMVRNDTCD